LAHGTYVAQQYSTTLATDQNPTRLTSEVFVVRASRNSSRSLLLSSQNQQQQPDTVDADASTIMTLKRNNISATVSTFFSAQAEVVVVPPTVSSSLSSLIWNSSRKINNTSPTKGSGGLTEKIQSIHPSRKNSNKFVKFNAIFSENTSRLDSIQSNSNRNNLQIYKQTELSQNQNNQPDYQL
jgi:hypothetical protein